MEFLQQAVGDLELYCIQGRIAGTRQFREGNLYVICHIQEELEGGSGNDR